MQKLSASMKALATLVKDFSNHNILLTTKNIFYDMTNQIEPDKRAELLAGKIKLYEKLVTKSKVFSVDATKGEPGMKKEVFPSFFNRK